MDRYSLWYKICSAVSLMQVIGMSSWYGCSLDVYLGIITNGWNDENFDAIFPMLNDMRYTSNDLRSFA